jgi:hypothetical protein
MLKPDSNAPRSDHSSSSFSSLAPNRLSHSDLNRTVSVNSSLFFLKSPIKDNFSKVGSPPSFADASLTLVMIPLISSVEKRLWENDTQILLSL